MRRINLNGDINDYSRWYLETELAQAKGDDIHLVINSLGGRVDCAIAMRQMLQEHNVTAEITGFVASAATFLALGAKTVKMHSTSMWLAHKCSLVTDVYGALNADDLASVIAKLEAQKKMQEAVDANIAGIYFSFAQAKGKSLKDVCDMMTEATWMSAEECREWGFVDEIIEDKRKCKMDGSIKNLLNSYQLPIPSIEDTEDKKVEVPEDKESSLLEKIVGILDRFLPKEEKAVKEQLAEFKDKLAQSEALVANLQKVQDKYNELSDAVNGIDETVAQAETAEDKASAIRQLLAKALQPAPALNPVNTTEKADFSDIAKDPVNNY